MQHKDFINNIERVMKGKDGIYIYGAGVRAREVFYILSRAQVKIDGFLTTTKGKSAFLMGVPIFEAKYIVKKNIAIILGLGDVYTQEVISYLRFNGVDLSRVIDAGEYVSEVKGSKLIENYPVLEITTVIGCRVNCKYCPQNLLLKTYFEEDKKRKNKMEREDFSFFLSRLPNNVAIMFAGMSEPFLNENCFQMIEEACEKNRDVRLYTTLEGTSYEEVVKLSSLPLRFFGLHVADKKGYAKITVNEEYYRKLELLFMAKKNGEPFVDNISAQAEPLETIQKMCRDTHEIVVSLHDRGNNLQGDEISSRENNLLKGSFYCCFLGENLDTNVVLPDGTVLLCDNDYGMRHVLGNLFESTYQEIRQGNTMQEIRRGFQGDSTIDLLCRKCVLAIAQRDSA